MFWQRFTELCTINNKFPNNVAADLGLSNATTTGWKQGSKPRPATLIKIADYFGVTVEYLKGETDEKNPAPENKGGGIELSDRSAELISAFEELNEEGQEKVLSYTDDLIRAGIYKNSCTTGMVSKNA